jgi:hypothetical protein
MMRNRHSVRDRLALSLSALLPALMLASCAPVGPKTIRRDQPLYR